MHAHNTHAHRVYTCTECARTHTDTRTHAHRRTHMDRVYACTHTQSMHAHRHMHTDTRTWTQSVHMHSVHAHRHTHTCTRTHPHGHTVYTCTQTHRVCTHAHGHMHMDACTWTHTVYTCRHTGCARTRTHTRTHTVYTWTQTHAHGHTQPGCTAALPCGLLEAEFSRVDGAQPCPGTEALRLHTPSATLPKRSRVKDTERRGQMVLTIQLQGQGVGPIGWTLLFIAPLVMHFWQIR